MRDPYSVLGVSKNASDEAIRKAYRQLAKKYHPDHNPGDKAAEEKFKEASVAFDILGDKDKRRQFDRGEIDAHGNQRVNPFGGHQGQGGFRGQAHQAHGGFRQGGGHGFDDIGDIFSDLFGGGMGGGQRGRGPVQGRDVRYRMEVDFLEAAKGVRKRVTMQDGRALDISIPAGLKDGQSLRLRGQGEAGFAGGPAGDVYVDVSVRAHPFFEREEEDIYLEIPITLSEAVLGAKIVVPTVHGDVSVRVPRGTSSGSSLRLRGKGIENAKSGKAGDQFIKLKLVLPEKEDLALAEFIENWRGDKDYNPRSKMLRK